MTSNVKTLKNFPRVREKERERCTGEGERDIKERKREKRCTGERESARGKERKRKKDVEEKEI